MQSAALANSATPQASMPEAISFYVDHPVDWVKDVIGVTPDNWQGDALNALVVDQHVAIRAGSGPGKSALLSWQQLHFLSNRPHPKVPVTAPTQHQLFDILWAESKKWIDSSEYLSQTLVWTQTKIAMKGHEATWFSVARTARIKPKSDVADTLQGFHADHLLFIIDEAPAVPEAVFVALEGGLTGANAYSLMAGNPSRVSGSFYDAFHKLSDVYATFHVNSEDSPRVSKKWIERMRRTCGPDYENNMVYWIKVLGKFPRSATGDDILIPVQHVDALRIKKTISNLEPTEVWGLDPARYGKDNAALVGRSGYLVHTTAKKPYCDEIQLAEWTMETLGSTFNGILVVEVVGYGAGAFDILKRQLGKDHVVGFVPQAKVLPEQLRKVAGFEGLKPENFRNSRAAAWWRLSKHIHELWIPNMSTEMEADLAHMRYRLDNNVIQMVTKEDLRDDLGRSPDEGDALMLTFAGEFASENPILVNVPIVMDPYIALTKELVDTSAPAHGFMLVDEPGYEESWGFPPSEFH